MKDVLLAIDESEERAVAQAETVVDLLEEGDVRGHLFHDFTDNPAGASILQVPSVKEAARILEAADIEVSYHEGSGDPSTAILETAEELDADVICISGRKRSPAGKLLFGSVAQAVILGTERPVLVCSASSRQ